MHPVQSTEAIQWAERQHQELVALAERDQLGRTLHQRPEVPNAHTIDVTALVMRLAVVVVLAAVVAAAGI
jgi:hypothetical protein